MEIDKLKAKLPAAVFSELPEICTKYDIKTNLRLAHFLAQCHHESSGFTAKIENLNYSAQVLKRTFSKYFTSYELNVFSHHAEKIANRVYANRMGNGSEASRDGYRYRGRGFIQLTGKDNYRLFGRSINVNLLDNPDLVASQYPLMSAAFFFGNNHIWNLCDNGDDVADVKAVTKAVNGGYNGLDDRVKLFCDYMAILNK